MTDKMKEWIDEQSYETLLFKWRFGATSNPMFQGEVGQYYSRVMGEKRAQEPDGGVGASKRIGW